MKHLTPEQKQHILTRYQGGMSLRAIGREMGRPDITIRRTLESLGVTFGKPRTTNKRSSPETEVLVVHLYDQGSTWAQIMEQTSVTSGTVSKILARNGRSFDRHGSSAGKEDLIRALYESGHSTRAIGDMLDLGKTTVNTVIEAAGDSLRQPGGCENPDFFEHVDTPEKAYWLGFLGADGCMITTAAHPEGSHLSIQLGIKDRAHLEKFHQVIGASGKVRTGVRESFGKKHGYAELSIYSARLKESLLSLGIEPRKSPMLAPWDGPEDLMSYYWCGLFDGDGSIAHKSGDLYTVFLCGSEACVRKFTEWAGGTCGTKATPYFRSGCWYVSISGRYQVPKLLRALYENTPVSLERKKALADSIIIAAA